MGLSDNGGIEVLLEGLIGCISGVLTMGHNRDSSYVIQYAWCSYVFMGGQCECIWWLPIVYTTAQMRPNRSFGQTSRNSYLALVLGGVLV